MSKEAFLAQFRELLDKDCPKVIHTTAYRTLTDEEAQRLAAHCYEWFQHQARYQLAGTDLLMALLKTRRYLSEQDRAEAMSRILI